MITLTLFATISSLEEVAGTLEDALGDVVAEMKEVSEQYNYELQDKSILKLYIPPHADTEEKLAVQLNGISNFYRKVETEHKNIQEGLLRQITLWNCMIAVSFEDTGNEERANYIFGSVISAAKKLSGYLLMQNLSLLNGDGKLVFSADGESELDELYPIMQAQKLYQREETATPEDIARYQRSIDILKSKNIPYLEEMKLALMESDANIKSVEEIAQRAIALFAVGVYSEVLLSEDSSLDEASNEISALNERFEVDSYFTDEELLYIEKTEVDRNMSIQFIWKYECSALLLWAIGIIKDLNDPNTICNVAELAQTIRSFDNLAQLIQSVKLKSKDELLQQQDLMMRYHWVCIEKQIKQEKLPESLDSGVVMERHLALNWLVTGLFGCEWDEVETPA